LNGSCAIGLSNAIGWGGRNAWALALGTTAKALPCSIGVRRAARLAAVC
jgi:hypothetical protein